MPVVNFLDKVGISANEVTDFGVAATVLGSKIASSRDPNHRENREKSLLTFVVLSVSQLVDAIDGQLARKQGTAGTVDGEIKDTLADRQGELAMAKARIVGAQKRGNRLGVFAAAINAATNALPSKAKAYAEVKGVVVAESGQDIFGFLGTRAPRVILAVISTAFPRIKYFPFQTVADFAVAAANFKTTIDRLQLAKSNAVLLQQEARDNSFKRFLALGRFQLRALREITATLLSEK